MRRRRPNPSRHRPAAHRVNGQSPVQGTSETVDLPMGTDRQPRWPFASSMDFIGQSGTVLFHVYINYVEWAFEKEHDVAALINRLD